MGISLTIGTLPSYAYSFNVFSNILLSPLLSCHRHCFLDSGFWESCSTTLADFSPSTKRLLLSWPSLAAYSVASSLYPLPPFAWFLPLFENCHSRNGHRFGGRSWVLDPCGCDAEKNCLHFSGMQGKGISQWYKSRNRRFLQPIWVQKMTRTYVHIVKIILWK